MRQIPATFGLLVLLVLFLLAGYLDHQLIEAGLVP